MTDYTKSKKKQNHTSRVDHDFQYSVEDTNNVMVVARGPKSRALYITAWCMYIAVVVESASSSSLIYTRLGYINVKRMRMLAAKGVLESLKLVIMSICKICIMGKQKQVRFTKVAKKS